jgi:hypothetical protein
MNESIFSGGHWSVESQSAINIVIAGRRVCPQDDEWQRAKAVFCCEVQLEGECILIGHLFLACIIRNNSAESVNANTE